MTDTHSTTPVTDWITHPDVLAIIVTYNPRLDGLERTLASIDPQVGTVIIVDNGSKGELSDLNLRPEWVNVHIHRVGTNLGIGGGHNVGFQLAQARGAKYVILLDQDSVPATNMVHELYSAIVDLESQGKKIAAVGARYLDKRLNNKPPFVQIKYGMVFRQYPRHPRDQVPVSYLIASGSLIPMDTVSAVGGMVEPMFMDYLDLEWGMRAHNHGFHCYGVFAATMEHEIGHEPIRFLGRRYMVHSALGHYYMVRNAVWLYRQKHIPFQWKVCDFWRLLLRIGCYSVLARPQHKHVAMMARGIRDGIRGRMGKFNAD